MTGECEFETYPEMYLEYVPAETCKDPTYPGETYCPQHTEN